MLLNEFLQGIYDVVTGICIQITYERNNNLMHPTTQVLELTEHNL